jgi:hypothetical protein
MSGPDELRTIRLVQLPLRLWAETKQHTDELLREFTIIAAGRDDDTSDEHATPVRLLALVDALRQQYGAGSTERDDRLFAALDAGLESFEEVLELPAAAAGATQALGDMLDEADEYCRQGQHLLTLATPAEHVRFRQWYLREIARQLDGAAPTPWPQYAG